MRGIDLDRLAIFDIGTNTIILLVAEIAPGGTIRVLNDEARFVRIGEGMHAHKRFLPGAMERGLDALRELTAKAHKLGATRLIAVGTAALRNAANAGEFMTRARDEFGLAIAVISGAEEARLIHVAVAHDFPRAPKPVLVLDIGGGSTEFIFDAGHNDADESPDGDAIDAHSLPFGSVKLNEQFLSADPPSPRELAALDTYLLGELASLPAIVPKTLVATAGTATTLSALTQGLTRYDASRVHGGKIMTRDLASWRVRLEAMTHAERLALPCMEPKRADVIVAGALILEAVARHFTMDEITVSDRGLRFGILYEEMSRHGDAGAGVILPPS